MKTGIIKKVFTVVTEKSTGKWAWAPCAEKFESSAMQMHMQTRTHTGTQAHRHTGTHFSQMDYRKESMVCLFEIKKFIRRNRRSQCYSGLHWTLVKIHICTRQCCPCSRGLISGFPPELQYLKPFARQCVQTALARRWMWKPNHHRDGEAICATQSMLFQQID